MDNCRSPLLSANLSDQDGSARTAPVLDAHQRKALAELAAGVLSAGETIGVVSAWNEPGPRDAHVRGAVRCARRSLSAIEALVSP